MAPASRVPAMDEQTLENLIGSTLAEHPRVQRVEPLTRLRGVHVWDAQDGAEAFVQFLGRGGQPDVGR